MPDAHIDIDRIGNRRTSARAALLLPICASALLAACTVLPAAGPSTRAVGNAGDRSTNEGQIQIVDVTDAVAGRLVASSHKVSFADALNDAPVYGAVVGAGDSL